MALSLNMAIVATGSVAAISAPNTRAEAKGQPIRAVMPAATKKVAARARHRREDEDRSQIALQLTPAKRQRRLEQQRRQDEVEDEIMRQMLAQIEPDEFQRRADDDESDRVGKFEPTRRDRHEHGDRKQRDEVSNAFIHPSPLAPICEAGKSEGGSGKTLQTFTPPCLGVQRRNEIVGSLDDGEGHSCKAPASLIRGARKIGDAVISWG